MNISEQIRQLCKQKNAIIMAHYYTDDSIQAVADFTGDSLALAQKAAQTDADIIVMCGVHFMGETAKILCPNKKVLIPDMSAGCSLANSCEAKALEQYKIEHPDHMVVSYVNTSARVKALTDVVVTSSNARKIVEQLPTDQPILFGPDQNLGRYINEVTSRDMILWDGACHVHSRFNGEDLKALKAKYTEAKVLAHPECKKDILDLADKVGSTKALLDFAINDITKQYIVITENGILYEMRRACPDKEFISIENKCEYMRLNSLEKLYDCLKNESPEITVPQDIATRALVPIERMLKMS